MAPEPIAVIPVAGVGTRLRPHTYTLPKVLLHVAGRPILAHILDDLPGLGIHEVVLIVGYLGERVQEYVDRQYPKLKVHYAQQPDRLGLGHAVSLARPFAGERPVLVILGDTVFDADLRPVLESSNHRIGVKAVDDPKRFGIVEINGAGRVTLMVEKPERPASNLAITGIYFFTSGAPLFRALDEIQARDIRTKGEFQLTDAMQVMLENGEVFTTFPVEGWFDCGRTETLLETNRVLLGKQGGQPAIPGSVVHPPVVVAPTAVVENCILGPHVSVAAGVRLRNAGVRDSIINEDAVVEDILVEGSVVGEGATVRGTWMVLNVGSSSEVSIG